MRIAVTRESDVMVCSGGTAGVGAALAGVKVLYRLFAAESDPVHPHLLVTGRCISTTHQANGSTRVSCTGKTTGEAAETLAAFADTTGRNIRSVPYSRVAKQLTHQGALFSV